MAFAYSYADSRMFFYVEDSFVTMPSYTKFYKLHTNTVHNAFNAGKKDRLHLAFNNADQEVIYDTREKIIELHKKLKDTVKNRLKNIDKVDLLLNQEFYRKFLKFKSFQETFKILVK